ncbi:glycosyltransferase family 2 protein [Bradyrhizobium betae]
MPLLSVVVPTLDRPDTLRHALATMACQPAHADCEFIVQNNGGNPEIAKAVADLQDERFKHFASETVLTMTDNWEAALGHASGEYIAFLGDDDGLMPYACATASDLLSGRKIDLLSWRAYSYYWPGYYHPAFRNRLLAEIDLASSAKHVSSRDELARIFGFQVHYAHLPMIYNSFVRRTVIDRMRAVGGRYFIGLSPDVASGIANAALTESFVRLSRPLSMAGFSQHSTGHALFFETSDLLETSRGARISARLTTSRGSLISTPSSSSSPRICSFSSICCWRTMTACGSTSRRWHRHLRPTSTIGRLCMIGPYRPSASSRARMGSTSPTSSFPPGLRTGRHPATVFASSGRTAWFTSWTVPRSDSARSRTPCA